MKISKFIKELGEKFPGKLKIVRKGIFRILINEQAFFLAKEFDMKITKLDKETIKKEKLILAPQKISFNLVRDGINFVGFRLKNTKIYVGKRQKLYFLRYLRGALLFNIQKVKFHLEILLFFYTITFNF